MLPSRGATFPPVCFHPEGGALGLGKGVEIRLAARWGRAQALGERPEGREGGALLWPGPSLA